MGFSSPVVGGANILIRPAIQSPNYITSVSGWTINRDGSAEFNNLTIRGTFQGTNFELNTNGLFFYSGTPALGNLIESHTNNSGTDSHGNAYLPGATNYKKITATDFQAYQTNAGGWALWTATAAGGPWNLVFLVNLQVDEVGVSFASNINSGQIVMGETAAAMEITPPASNLGLWVLGNGAIQSGQYILAGVTAQATPSQGVEFDFDSGHNFNITGDNVGGNNHLLIFNFDISLRSAVTPSAPASGIRITADSSSNMVFTPSAAALLKLVNSSLWIQDNPGISAPANGVVTGVDAGGDRLSTISPHSGNWNLPSGRLSTFPNNSIGGTVASNLSSGQINANDAEIGATYEVEVNGQYTQATTTGTTLTFWTKLAGNIGSTQTIAAANVGAPGGTGRFIARSRVTCVGPLGASCVWRSELMVILTANAAPGTSPAFCDCDAATGSITADSTTNLSLQCQAAWGSGTNNPNITSRVSTFKRVN